MKKQIFILAFIAIALLTPLSVFAEKPTENKSEIRKIINEERKEVKQNIAEEKKEVREEIKELKKELKEEKKGLIEEVKKLVKDITNIKNTVARILQGQVASISDSSLTVSKDGKTYTVNTDSNTQFRRHYWGKSSLSEISVGDNVNVSGKFTDEDKTTILARMVRDTSIQKRKGVFFGNVTSKTDTTMVIETKRGTQTVTFYESTKFVTRDEKIMTAGQINVGDRVRVKGLWDKTSNEITEVNQVKDFTQPMKNTATSSATPSVSPSPSPSVSPTVTPSASPSPTPAS